jgi:hypothetical protein
VTLYLYGYTIVASIHDYTQFKQEFPVDGQQDEVVMMMVVVVKWFKDFVLWLDLGYLGVQEAYEADEVKMPHKKLKIVTSAGYASSWNRPLVG